MPTARTRIAATLLAATLTTTACQDAGAPAPGPTIDEAIMCNLAFTHAERLAKQIQALADQQDAFAAVVAFQAEQARTFPDYEARKAQLTPEFARLRDLGGLHDLLQSCTKSVTRHPDFNAFAVRWNARKN